MILVVPHEEVAKCEAEGGCALFTRARIQQLIEQAREQSASACWRSRKEV